jgi:uncharacterized protein involved in outer membrane biogenesis
VNLRRTLSIVSVACGVFVAAVIVVVLVWDWSWFRGPAERAASDALGRQVSIGGPISVDLGLTLGVVLHDVAIANTAWGQSNNFARAERISVSLSIPALIRGKTDIRALALSGLDVALERNVDGDANWTFDNGNSDEEKNSQTVPARVTVQDATFQFNDRRANTSFDLKVASLNGVAGEDTTTLDGEGRFKDAPFKVSLRAGPISALRDEARAFPVELSARVGESTMSATGSIRDPLEMGSVDVRIELAGPDLSRLATLAGFDIPETPSFALRGHIAQEGDTLTFENISARLGENIITVSGEVRSPAKPGPMDLRLDAKGNDLAMLAGLAGRAMPETGSYEFKGRVVHSENAWKLDDFSARLGRSDLAGNLQLATGSTEKGGALARVTGKLHSNVLDLDDFDELFVSGTKAEGNAKKSPNTSAAADRIIPDVRLPVEWLRAAEGDVRITVRSIANVYGSIDSLAGHAVLEDGKLTVDPLDLTAGDGKLAASATVGAKGDSVTTSLKGEVRKLDIATVLPKGVVGHINGQLGGSVMLAGGGESLVPLLKSLRGQITAFLAGGELNRLLAEATGLDVLGTLRSLVGDRAATTRIRCMVADFGVDGGVLDSKALVLDTDSLLLTGDGRISLPEETVNITLTPRARGINPLSFSAPLVVSGSFRDVRVAPQVAGLGVEAGKTFALGLLLGPMVALAPVIEEKLVGDSNCAALLKDARTPADGKTDGRDETPLNPSPKAPTANPPDR